MEQLNHFGEVLRYYRKKKGFSQADLANNICSERQLIRIENNQALPNVYIFVNLCIRLDVDYSDFIKKVLSYNPAHLNEKVSSKLP